MRGLPRPDLSDGRIRLRPPTERDVETIAAACQDAEIQLWTTVPSPYSEDDAREFIAHAERSWENDRGAALLATDAATDELLGATELTRAPHDDAVGEIGYWVKREARGRGIAAAATRVLSRWGFEELGLARVQLFADSGNGASQRAAERAGFTREGLLRAYVSLRGTRRDYVVFSMLPSDVAASVTENRPAQVEGSR